MDTTLKYKHCKMKYKLNLLWRGLEPPRFSAIDFESIVSTISPPKLYLVFIQYIFSSEIERILKLKSSN